MNRSTKTLLAILVVLAVVIGGGYGLYSNLSKSGTTGPPLSGGLSSGQDRSRTAPDFSVTDRDGNTVSLSDFFGKPIVLNFWASWCGPCRGEMPDFDRVFQEKGNSVHFMMVNLTDGSRETRKTATEFVESNGFSFPVYFDESYEASSVFQVGSIPLTVLIDKDGAIADMSVGSMSYEILTKKLEELEQD